VLEEIPLFLDPSLVCLAASAQKADVKRNVNLRADTSTDNPPIELLKPPAQLTLLEPDKTQDYYHVTAPDGKTGFVWAKNVEIQNGAPTPGPAGTPSPLIATGQPVDWWFAFKFNSASFSKCAAGAVRACLFGGQVQSAWTSFSQQYAVASSDSKTFQIGTSLCGGHHSRSSRRHLQRNLQRRSELCRLE
jgi:hypothetical protein